MRRGSTFRLRGLAAALLALLVVIAADPSLARKSKGAEAYLSKAEIAPALVLAEPPAKGSPVELGEIDELLKMQAARTPEAAREAEDDAERTLKRFLLGTGVDIPREKAPLVHELIAEAGNELRHALDSVKDGWKRQRPFLAYDRLKPCERNRPSSQSYPSGHAAVGALYGELMAAMLPEKAAVMRKRGDDYGRSRLVCGFHYPSDVAAGRLAGQRMATALLANAAFRKDFEAAAEELKSLSR